MIYPVNLFRFAAFEYIRRKKSFLNHVVLDVEAGSHLAFVETSVHVKEPELNASSYSVEVCKHCPDNSLLIIIHISFSLLWSHVRDGSFLSSEACVNSIAPPCIETDL